MSWIAVIGGVVVAGVGVASRASANKKAKAALAKRKSYQTPDEVFQILNATQSKAQGDLQTRDFQTNQIDRAFSNQLEVAEMLGADPNDLSAMFDQKIQGIIQVGQQFHASNMESFGKYLGALDMVAQNRAAEYGSQQNIVKDELQAAAAQKADANATINSGINLGLSGYSAYQSNKLYTDKQQNNAYNNNFGFDNQTISDATQGRPN